MKESSSFKIEKVLKYLKTNPKKFALVFIILLVTVIGFLLVRGGEKENLDTIEVKRGTVAQIVSVNGRVKAARGVKLSFERGGRITSIHKRVGDRVSAGDQLVSLDNGDLLGQLLAAEAAVKAEEARLAELKRGTRTEDLEAAKVVVDNAINNVENAIRTGYSLADDAIRNKVDQFISNPKSVNPQLNFAVNNSQLKRAIEDGRVGMEKILNDWNTIILGNPLSTSTALSTLSSVKIYVNTIQKYLDDVSVVVNSLSASSNLTQTSIDGYKSSIVAARTNLSTVLTNLSSAEEVMKNSISALIIKLAGTAVEQIKMQEAKLEGAQANVINLKAQLEKTIIRSPINGLLVKQDGRVGEIAISGSPVVEIISDELYEIEVYVPEADIAKIKTGNPASVTLDAYGNDVFFDAVVSSIELAETIIGGISTYKTILQFTKHDKRIKSGMTANVDIFGEKKENVLYVPARTVITDKDGKKTVNRISGALSEKVTVETGLRGHDGNIEIISGLSEGDIVKLR